MNYRIRSKKYDFWEISLVGAGYDFWIVLLGSDNPLARETLGFRSYYNGRKVPWRLGFGEFPNLKQLFHGRR
jgi:hypothetical protein